MLTIPEKANFLLFIISFNNLSLKKPKCQQSLSQNWQLVSSHCSMKKEQTDIIHQRQHSSTYQFLWCFISKYFLESSKWTYVLCIKENTSISINLFYESIILMSTRKKREQLKTKVILPKPLIESMYVVIIEVSFCNLNKFYLCVMFPYYSALNSH